MKAEFTPTGGGLVTLGDDSAKWLLTLEEVSGKCLEAVEDMFGQANALRYLLGNLKGNCVFTAAKSHADADTMAAFFKTEYARINTSGLLKFTFTAATWSMANANCIGVQRAEVSGVRLKLRYTFGITTIT